LPEVSVGDAPGGACQGCEKLAIVGLLCEKIVATVLPGENDDFSDSRCTTRSKSDDLATVVGVSPDLPDHLRAAIMALVNTAKS
jgi:hypothetical protein